MLLFNFFKKSNSCCIRGKNMKGVVIENNQHTLKSSSLRFMRCVMIIFSFLVNFHHTPPPPYLSFSLFLFTDKLFFAVLFFVLVLRLAFSLLFRILLIFFTSILTHSVRPLASLLSICGEDCRVCVSVCECSNMFRQHSVEYVTLAVLYKG